MPLRYDCFYWFVARWPAAVTIDKQMLCKLLAEVKQLVLTKSARDFQLFRP